MQRKKKYPKSCTGSRAAAKTSRSEQKTTARRASRPFSAAKQANYSTYYTRSSRVLRCTRCQQEQRISAEERFKKAAYYSRSAARVLGRLVRGSCNQQGSPAKRGIGSRRALQGWQARCGSGSNHRQGSGISGKMCNRKTTGSLKVIKVSYETEFKALSYYAEL